jgi:hypothetical protein
MECGSPAAAFPTGTQPPSLPRNLSAYDFPSSVGCGGATGTGLYSGAGLAGLGGGNLIAVFFGFFFSRPRLSRLPMMDSLPPKSNG